MRPDGDTLAAIDHFTLSIRHLPLHQLAQSMHVDLHLSLDIGAYASLHSATICHRNDYSYLYTSFIELRKAVKLADRRPCSWSQAVSLYPTALDVASDELDHKARMLYSAPEVAPEFIATSF